MYRVLFLLSLLALSGCFPSANSTADLSSEDNPASAFGVNLEPFISANHQFAVKFYQLQRQQQNSSFIFSPFSLQASLATLLFGAAGRTRQEIVQAAQYPLENADPFVLSAVFYDFEYELKSLPSPYHYSLATAFWAPPSFNLFESFEAMVQESLGPVTVIDTSHPESAISTINYWTKQETRGEIDSILKTKELPGPHSFLLTSALAIEGVWNTPLDHPQRLRTFVNEHFRALEIPCTTTPNGYLTLLLLIPENGTSLEWIEEHLLEWSDWRIQMEVKRLDLKNFPMATIESSQETKSLLQAMGVSLAFNPKEADFSSMAEDPHLFLTSVIHGAALTLNQEGINGAVATSTASFDLFSQEPTASLDISQRPFLFFLFHQPSDLILLLGRYIPSLNDTATP